MAAIRPSSWLLLAVWFATALSVLAIYGIVQQNVAQVRTLSGQNELVTHTLEVEQALDGVMLELTTAESQQRTFIITGSDASLQSYIASAARVPGALERLGSLSKDNPEQTARFQHLREKTLERLALLHEFAEVRQNEGLDGVLARLDPNVSRTVMDDLRVTASLMSKVEADLLQIPP